ASTNMIMSVAMEASAADEARITFIVSRSLSGDLKDVSLKGQVREVDRVGIHPLKELDVGNVGWNPKQVSQTFKVNNDIRLVAEMTLTATRAGGAPFEEKFIYYWPGKSGEKFDLVAGGIASTYKRAPAKKTKQYPKPERVTLIPHEKPIYLECRGIGYSIMKVKEAAKLAGIEEVKAGSFQNTFAGSNLSYVPTSYEEMLAYDFVVLNNVTAESMTDFGLELLKDYVKAGGGLLVIGGWFAFDPGGYAGTQLEEILPVKLFGSPFSWERLVPPVPLTITAEARCLAGARWAGTPLCYWRQKLSPREGSWVEIMAGDKPFLVCGAYGKGRVAAITTHAYGNPSSGETPFWEDGAWVDNLSKLVKWLAFGAKK
ncbi:MAG: glutamine amidotransferase, partial [Kiritimatiellae bacterium]|nr:glutamine amidotransferase [Kiritimatiellia bacterium]